MTDRTQLIEENSESYAKCWPDYLSRKSSFMRGANFAFAHCDAEIAELKADNMRQGLAGALLSDVELVGAYEYKKRLEAAQQKDVTDAYERGKAILVEALPELGSLADCMYMSVSINLDKAKRFRELVQELDAKAREVLEGE